MLYSNMLPDDRTHASLDSIAPKEQAQDNGLAEIVNFAQRFLRRQYGVIILTAVLGLAASLIYLRTTPPTYTAQASVLFGNPKAQFVQQQSVLAETPFDSSQLESQIQILKSKAIATLVINQLRLADDPEFQDSGPSWRSIIQGWLTGGNPAQRPDPTDRLVDNFSQRLSAIRLGYSSVIEISFSAGSAQRSAEIANAIANTYISDQLNAKMEANRTATAWLQDRLKELGQQALTAERAVDKFKSDNNIVAADGKLMDEERVADFNRRIVAARAQTSDLRAKLNRLEAVLAANSGDSAAVGSLDAAGSDVLSSPIITSLRQQYLEYARRESEYSARYGADHLAVVTMRTTMKSIRSSILEEMQRLAEVTRNDYETAKERQQDAEKQLAQAVTQSHTTNSAESTMRELESGAKGYRSLYELFLQRYMGSVQQESFPISDARVISRASPPQSKSKPKGGIILALGLFGGIALGAALGFLREIMDRGFRTSAQLEATLQVPCLSLVPLLKDFSQTPSPVTSDNSASERMLLADSRTYWAATALPLSRFAESIRLLKLAIDLNPATALNKIIGITSALPNEGKSTIAASLAQVIARTGKRVVLVDCDLRNPSLTDNLAPNARAGILDVLSGTRSLEDVIWRDTNRTLALLPARKSPTPSQISDVLLADQTRKLFENLRATHDYVVVDLPPLAPVADVRATGPLVDCFVMVVEWGATKIDVVQHALHTAPNVCESLAGVVLNKTDMTALKRYENYCSDYYDDNHYARYVQASAE